MFKGKVGDPAQVQAHIVRPEQMTVPHRDQGCSLSSQGYILTSKIENHGHFHLRVDSIPVSQLEGKPAFWLVKDRVPV
jgi:hypothetical protein